MWKVLAAIAILGALVLMLTRSERPTELRNDSGDQRNSALNDEPVFGPEPVAPETVRIAAQASGSFYARVVASESGGPIVAARVFTGDNHWEWNRKPVAVSDSNGDLDLPLDQYIDQTLTLMAKGRGPARLFVDNQHASRKRCLRIPLHLEATLSGWILDGTGSQRSVQVHLSTDKYRLSSSWKSPQGTPRWVAEVGQGGSFRIEGLPPNAPLRAWVRSGQETLLRVPSELILEPGELRQVEWSIEPGATISGQAINAADGQPESDLEIWLAPGAEADGTYFRKYAKGVQKVRSDWQGRFSYTGIAPGEWAVGPGPQQPVDEGQLAENAVAPAVTRIEILDEYSKVEVVVRVHRGLYISGRVIDPVGQPAPRESVRAYAAVDGGWAHRQSAEDGRFRLGPLVPAVFSVSAGHGSSRFASSEEVEARSGQTDVTLRLKQPASISGMVIDALTGRAAPGDIYLQGVEPWGYRTRNTGGGGSFEFTAAEPGRHHLIARTEDGRIGFLKDIVVSTGASVTGIKLLVREGGQVTVCYEGPLESANYRAFSNGVMIALDGLRNGTEATFFAPPGPLKVKLLGLDRKAGTFPPPILFERSQDVHVRSGATAKVTFKIED